jgi:hypothetical protein
VIVDNLDFISITCSKNEANTILIVNPYAPLTSAIPFELLKSVAGRHSQKRYLGSRVKQQ